MTYKLRFFADFCLALTASQTLIRGSLSEDMLREDLITLLPGNPYDVEFGLTVGDVVYDNLNTMTATKP